MRERRELLRLLLPPLLALGLVAVVVRPVDADMARVAPAPAPAATSAPTAP